jgi:hypothetical protein
MQLYRASCLKYDKGDNLFPVEDKFHMDIEQIREGLVVFGIAPWKNDLPDPECGDSPFFDEGQTDMWGRNLCRKRIEAL